MTYLSNFVKPCLCFYIYPRRQQAVTDDRAVLDEVGQKSAFEQSHCVKLLHTKN